jgi:hypothetical protein
MATFSKNECGAGQHLRGTKELPIKFLSREGSKLNFLSVMGASWMVGPEAAQSPVEGIQTVTLPSWYRMTTTAPLKIRCRPAMSAGHFQITCRYAESGWPPRLCVQVRWHIPQPRWSGRADRHQLELLRVIGGAKRSSPPVDEGNSIQFATVFVFTFTWACCANLSGVREQNRRHYRRPHKRAWQRESEWMSNESTSDPPDEDMREEGMRNAEI